MSQAASLGRSDVYLTILNKKQGQALPLDVGVRAIMETKILYTYLAKIADKGRLGTAYTSRENRILQSVKIVWSNTF